MKIFLGIIFVVIGISIYSYGLLKFGLTVGVARGEENVYLDCHYRGFTIMHNKRFKCEESDGN